jgi:hypothetical protein
MLRPNKPLELTPLRSSKIGAFLRFRISTGFSLGGVSEGCKAAAEH